VSIRAICLVTSALDRGRRINDAMVPSAVIEVYYMDNLEGAVTTAIEMACNRPF
jgi:hypothetical protein